MKYAFLSLTDCKYILRTVIDISNGKFLLQVIEDPTQRKHIMKWIRSIQCENYLMLTKQPWFVFDAIEFLNSLNFEGIRVFEYGSGGSTLYWLEKGASVVSIEHDPKWYNVMKGPLMHYKNIDYRLVEPEKTQGSFSQEGNPTDPDGYLSSSSKDRYFRNYVCQIDGFMNNFFDIISIDGRARPSCIKHSIDKVKRNGYIILDDADRGYYLRKSAKYLENFKRIEFKGICPCGTNVKKIYIYRKI